MKIHAQFILFTKESMALTFMQKAVQKLYSLEYIYNLTTAICKGSKTDLEIHVLEVITTNQSRHCYNNAVFAVFLIISPSMTGAVCLSLLFF